MNRDCEHIVIFSTEAPRRQESAAELQRFAWPLIAVASCGEALRHIALMQPAAIVVLTQNNGHVESAASLIRELRQRRPQLPVIALAEEHDDEVERHVRAAGASAYVTRSDANAESLIRAASAAHSPRPVEVSLHSGCSPPVRARAPTRNRGRPRHTRAE